MRSLLQDYIEQAADDAKIENAIFERLLRQLISAGDDPYDPEAAESTNADTDDIAAAMTRVRQSLLAHKAPPHLEPR